MVRGAPATLAGQMARPVAALERLFERLFEGPARLFGARLQPVQLQRRLERAMEAERRYGADRTYVPNAYTILLHPDDLAAFSSYQSSLEAELADALLLRARARGYTLLERPHVRLEESGSVPRRDPRINARVLDPLLLRPAPKGFRRVADPAGDRPAPAAPPPAVTASPSGLRASGATVTGAPGATGLASPVAHPGVTGRPGQARQPGSDTAVFSVPQASSPNVTLLVHAPGQPGRRVALGPGAFRIGRAADNDLTLADERVSRYHGQLVTRQGALVYTDLGSTNGSYVNGTGVTEIALGAGDVLQIGNCSLTVESDG